MKLQKTDPYPAMAHVHDMTVHEKQIEGLSAPAAPGASCNRARTVGWRFLGTTVVGTFFFSGVSNVSASVANYERIDQLTPWGGLLSCLAAIFCNIYSLDLLLHSLALYYDGATTVKAESWSLPEQLSDVEAYSITLSYKVPEGDCGSSIAIRELQHITRDNPVRGPFYVTAHPFYERLDAVQEDVYWPVSFIDSCFPPVLVAVRVWASIIASSVTVLAITNIFLVTLVVAVLPIILGLCFARAPRQHSALHGFWYMLQNDDDTSVNLDIRNSDDIELQNGLISHTSENAK